MQSVHFAAIRDTELGRIGTPDSKPTENLHNKFRCEPVSGDNKEENFPHSRKPELFNHKKKKNPFSSDLVVFDSSFVSHKPFGGKRSLVRDIIEFS